MAFALASCALCGLGSCLAQGLCMAARVCCCSLGAASGKVHVSKRAAKAFYIVLIALSSIFALVLYNYGDQISFLTDISVINDICTNKRTTTSQCFGASAVLRISLALAIFFGINTFTSFAADAFVGCWGFKVAIWLTLMIGCFFIPADAMEKYGEASRVFSLLFLLAMVIILIDAAYHLHEVLTAKIEAKDTELLQTHETVGIFQNLWKLLYLGISFGAIIGSFVGMGLLYQFSANRPDGITCNNNLAFLSITLIAGLIYTVLSMMECSGARGLMPPSLVWAYCTWLCWSAIYSNADVNCTPVPPDSSNTGATIVGMIIAACSLCYTAFSASRSLPHMFDLSKNPAAPAPAAAAESEPLTANAHPTGADKEEKEEDVEAGHAADYSAKETKEKAKEEPYSVVDSLIFSIILVLASMYMAPVLTNWVTDPSDVASSRTNPATMWVNMAAQWATTILYLWTLMAPVCCSGRDFS